MKNKLALCFIMIILSTSLCQAKEIAGIIMPDPLQADGAALVLNGAGVRTKFFMDLYVGGLYLKQKHSDADKVNDLAYKAGLKKIKASLVALL